jgi:hypothetical protein
MTLRASATASDDAVARPVRNDRDALDRTGPLLMGQSHRLTVQLRASEFPGLADTQPALEPRAVPIDVDDGERLRRPVLAAVEPHLQLWRTQAGLPQELTRGEIGLADEKVTMIVLGQGFAVDSAGHVYASNDLAGERYGDLRRAQELGLLKGDLSTIVVIPQPPLAGVGGGGWQSFEDALRFLWGNWENLAAAYGGWQALRAIMPRVRRATDALSKIGKHLSQRGFTPPRVIELVERRQWSVEQLSNVLGVSADELEQLLSGLGFQCGRDASGR